MTHWEVLIFGGLGLAVANACDAGGLLWLKYRSSRNPTPRTGAHRSVARRIQMNLAASAMGYVIGSLVWGAFSMGSVLTGALAGGLPWLAAWRRRRANEWQEFKEMPDFLELLSIGLGSGLNLEQAWDRAVAHLPSSSLKNKLAQFSSRPSLGQPRADALFELARQFNHSALASVFTLVIQSLKQGDPLQAVLAEQAQWLRDEVFFSLEKQAQTAGLRLLFPLVFFIFPSLFILLLAPLFIQLARSGGLF